MKWFADNAELYGPDKPDIPDHLIFGGVAIQDEPLRQIETILDSVRSRANGGTYAPLKWNFKDLKYFYEKAGRMELYSTLLNSSKEWRREVFREAANVDFTVMVSVLESYSKSRDTQRRKKDDLSEMVFDNSLMRLGLHARDVRPNATEVVLDWPDKGKADGFDNTYARAWSGGTGYNCGRLSHLGFAKAPFYASMTHCPGLQFADLVVGATREFLKHALFDDTPGIGVECVSLISKRFRGYPDNIFGRGVNISPNYPKFKQAVTTAINEHLKGQRYH